MTPLEKQLRECETHKDRLKLLEEHSPGANLCWADLSGMDLRGGSFVGANMRDANLRGVNLSGACLNDADLLNTDFRWADMRRTNFHRADLRGADFEGADLRGAVLSRADLRGAYLCKYDAWDVKFSDDDISIGCKTKSSIEAWDKWFAGVEEFKTKRGTPEFEEIRKNWEWAKGIWRRTRK